MTRQTAIPSLDTAFLAYLLDLHYQRSPPTKGEDPRFFHTQTRILDWHRVPEGKHLSRTRRCNAHDSNKWGVVAGPDEPEGAWMAMEGRGQGGQGEGGEAWSTINLGWFRTMGIIDCTIGLFCAVI